MTSLNIPLYRNIVSFVLVGASLCVVSLYLLNPVLAGKPAPVREEVVEPPPPVEIEPPMIVEEEEEEAEVVEATVRGLLRDMDTGALIEGVEVEARSPADANSPRIAVIDGSRFTLEGLKLCPYQVTARAEGYLPVWTELVPPMESRLELLLKPAGTVRVRVTDRYARRLKNVTFREEVTPSPDLPEVLSYRFDEGYFLVHGLPLGARRLVVEAEGYDSVCLDARVERDVVHTYWAVFE
jgi:hypothetical protein